MLNNGSELYSLDKSSTKLRKKKEDIYVSSLEQMIRNPPCGKICQFLYHNTTRGLQEKTERNFLPERYLSCQCSVVTNIFLYPWSLSFHYLRTRRGENDLPQHSSDFPLWLKRGRKISEEREIVSWILSLFCNTQQWYINIEEPLPTLSIKKFPERMKEKEKSVPPSPKYTVKGQGRKKKGGGAERR